MIRVKNVEKVGMCGNLTEVKFEFEFDNASTLPVKTYILGNTTYLIANNSIAINIVTNISYNYNEGIWTKVLSKSTIPQSNLTNVFTKNGSYDVVNNELKGISGIEVMVGSPDTKLIDKTITANNTYNAVDDNANGYSSVTVDVPNTYTAGDEGKVVSSGALVAQTSTNITSNGTVNTTTNNEVIVNVSNTYSAEDEGKVVNSGALVAQTAYPTEITKNRTYNTTNYNSVTVNVIGDGTPNSDVIFYDYDGSIVASYSVSDFVGLSTMPDNPTHEGLTAQGWNYTLTDAKSNAIQYGKLNIGQMYCTDDGKTRLYYTIPKDNLTLELYLYLENNTELDIDWGDNSEHTTWTSDDEDSSKLHEYTNGGKYIVAITVRTGKFSPHCNYNKTLTNVEIGSFVESIESETFSDCSALTSITIPKGVVYIGWQAFYQCSALTSITIPNSVRSIEEEAFLNCFALTSITIPNSVVGIEGQTFSQCSALTSITIPDNVESIEEGAFSDCSALTSITIPDDVGSIKRNTFSQCSALTSINFRRLLHIESNAFYHCSALTSITIPHLVTSIGGEAFSDCYVLSSITFESTTPPKLDETLNLPTTCVIRVPQGTLSAYTSAPYYPNPTEYIYEEY